MDLFQPTGAMMLRLSIADQRMTVRSINPRAEFNGGEKRKAMDISLAMLISADSLDMFAPGLRESLFTSIHNLAGPSSVRFPKLTEFPWDDEMINATLEVEIGIGPPLRFIDVKLVRFKIQPLEGGTANVQFTAQVHPGGGQIDALADYIQQEITASISPAPLPVLSGDKPSTSPTKRGKKITKAEADEQLKAMAALDPAHPDALQAAADALKSADEAKAAGEAVH